MGRHPRFWCRTTLHYRGWSFDDIGAFLGKPDVIDDNGPVVGSYYKIERVITGEKRLAARRDRKQEIDRLIKAISDRCPLFTTP